MTLSTETLVKAGAIVTGAADQPPAGTTPYQARTYHHPALGDRLIVRLVADELASAEDQTLQFLGFAPEPAGAAVGLGRRQALGFPAWAVVHDPDHASAAFAVVPELERAKRVLKSKPGNAKDQIVSIADRLILSAPKIVPSFYEEAGRAFIGEGNVAMAATLFAKARTVESAYGLDVDEAVREEAFLEFALAGALSAKALDEYAKELTTAYAPTEAFGTFRNLVVHRTRGGLPPTTGIPATLKRLARSARLDPTQATADVITDMASAPAFARTPLAFYRNATPAAVLAAQSSTDVALAMLRASPDLGDADDDGLALWLAILADSGAVRHLVTTPDQGSLLKSGEPADWVSRMVTRTPRREPGLEELVGRMRERLIADRVPLKLRIGWYRTPLDLIDVALELGIAVAGPGESAIQLDRWLAEPTAKRDLTATMADPDYRRALDQAVETYLRGAPATALLTIPGLAGAAGRWLDRRAAESSTMTVADLSESWSRTVSRLTPELAALNPAAAQTIRSTSFADALARTLRGGLLDERGWPALEEVVDRLDADTAVTVTSSWPHLLVRAAGQVWVVGPDRVELHHQLHPDAASVRDQFVKTVFVDGDLLVTWRTNYGSPPVAYWSSDPRNTFPLDNVSLYEAWADPLPVPGGGVTFGGPALRRGDRAIATEGTAVISDGVTFWRRDHTSTFRELDPAQGTLGRASLPAFLQQGAAEGELLLHSCDLRPYRGQPVGQWARRLPGGVIEVHNTAGRHFRGTVTAVSSTRSRTVAAPERLLGLPGADAPLLLFTSTRWGPHWPSGSWPATALRCWPSCRSAAAPSCRRRGRPS